MGSILGEHVLIPHPDGPAPPVRVVVAVTLAEGSLLQIEYRMTGALEGVAIPQLSAPVRTDELWRHSCFEAFLGLPDGSYAEFNFSLSSQWASYRFDGYRKGMRAANDLPVGRILVEQRPDRFVLTALFDIAPLMPKGPLKLALTAVVEQMDGKLSYLSLAHPPGKPDFHHPDCFVLDLPAASAP